jgi:uncharacterized protein YdhG (YjbR/CyaY superfamily)
MTSKATTIDQYIDELPEDRKAAISELRSIIIENLPTGFKEEMSYGMIGYVIPHEIYPDGYHCTPKLPLPFMNLASQKASINLYHMGIYAQPDLLDWFVIEYAKVCKTKLDMGKSCIRFKKMDDIPYDLIGALVAKVSVADWISWYESIYKNKLKK